MNRTHELRRAAETERVTVRQLRPTEEPAWIRRLLIGVTLTLLSLLILAPLLLVFAEAMSEGVSAWMRAVSEPAALHAISLTLLVAAVAVPVNVVFGLAASWLLARHRFRGRDLMLSFIDLPFAVSPVVAGLMFVLIFNAQSVIGGPLASAGIRVLFAPPSMILATIFVTFPIVARELIPLMEAQGADEELAALSLGASAWQMWGRVTLPRIRWGLLYGVILCNARTMGEFGAVSVVSGMIRGRTCTLPLHVEILYNEYQTAAAFAVASLLGGLALVTLALKEWSGRRVHDER
jgi:sulfate transport system permease protein